MVRARDDRRPQAAPRQSLTRRLAAGRAWILAALMLSTMAAGAFAMPAATFAWTSSTFGADSEQQLLAMTNQARTDAGLPALHWDATLSSIARWRSQDMIDRNYFSHAIPPSGEMSWDVMDQRGYCYNLAGENIGWNQGWADDQATAQIEESFLSSSTHRDNIMGGAWDAIGIGAYKGDDGKIMWTILFAHSCTSTPAPIPASAPSATPITNTPLVHLTGTRIVKVVAGSNNVVQLRFMFSPALAGMHVQIKRATRACIAGSGGIACASGRKYGSWSGFSALTTRVVDASGAVVVAVSSHGLQWISVTASFAGDATHPAEHTSAQQVRWR